jgi:hypothetical protein
MASYESAKSTASLQAVASRLSQQAYVRSNSVVGVKVEGKQQLPPYVSPPSPHVGSSVAPLPADDPQVQALAEIKEERLAKLAVKRAAAKEAKRAKQEAASLEADRIEASLAILSDTSDNTSSESDSDSDSPKMVMRRSKKKEKLQRAIKKRRLSLAPPKKARKISTKKEKDPNAPPRVPNRWMNHLNDFRAKNPELCHNQSSIDITRLAKRTYVSRPKCETCGK